MMITKLKNRLNDLITANKLKAFFDAWKEAISPASRLNQSCHQLKAAYYDLEENTISRLLREEEAQLRKRQLVNSLLTLTEKIEAGDLRGAKGTEAGDTAPPLADPLRDLMIRKLSALQRARILATDAAEQFKLDIDIQELKEGLSNLL
jgi:hypothetical protein